ncbi:MAG: hypothetical protein ACJ8EP_08185, partial [Sphingomicrobium sp.]
MVRARLAVVYEEALKNSRRSDHDHASTARIPPLCATLEQRGSAHRKVPSNPTGITASARRHWIRPEQL